MIRAMDHSDWLERIAPAEAANAIAKRSGLSPRTVAHQVKQGYFPAENVIAIAIAYGANPVGALVDTGYLAAEYAKQVDPMTALREVSDEQIADEVLRRMTAGSHPAFETPIDEYISDSDRHLRSVADNSPREDGHGGDESAWDA